MLVVNRFRVPVDQGEAFHADLEAARSALAARPGFVRGYAGRNADEPDLWVLVTQWEGAGVYRRALTAYEVKMTGGALLDRAVDEPSAYELLEPGTGVAGLDRRVVDADVPGGAR